LTRSGCNGPDYGIAERRVFWQIPVKELLRLHIAKSRGRIEGRILLNITNGVFVGAVEGCMLLSSTILLG